MSKMYEYLQEHNYISRNKNKDPFRQQELSKERAEAIANKFDNLLQQKDKELEARKQLIYEQDKELWALEHIINEAIEYVGESYNVTVEGIEGVADFFSKRNETLLKILRGVDKE